MQHRKSKNTPTLEEKEKASPNVARNRNSFHRDAIRAPVAFVTPAEPAASAEPPLEANAQTTRSILSTLQKKSGGASTKSAQEVTLEAEPTNLTEEEKEFCRREKFSATEALALKAITRTPPMSLEEAFILAKNNNISFADILICKEANFLLVDAINCKNNGMTLHDALIYRQVSLETKCAIEFRGGAPIQWMGEEVARKPLVIKEKSDKSEGFTSGCVRAKKAENKEEQHKHLDRLKKNNIYKGFYNIPLGKILTLRDKDGELRYTFNAKYSDPSKGRLTFSLTKDNTDPPQLYSIDLSHYGKKPDLSKWKMNLAGTTPPPWWPSSFAFSEALASAYPAQRVEFKSDPKTGKPAPKFVTELVYLTINEKAQIIPISTDNDVNGFGCSTETIRQMGKEKAAALVGTRINTSEQKGAYELIRARVALNAAQQSPANPEQEMQPLPPVNAVEAEVKTAQDIGHSEGIFHHETGFITAHGSHLMHRINELAVPPVSPKKGVFRPLQHADEDNNLEHPQDLGSTVVFTHDGHVKVFKTLEELVQYRIDTEKEQFFLVNENAQRFPLWIPYIARQINHIDKPGGVALPIPASVKQKFVECLAASGQKDKPVIDNEVRKACRKLLSDPDVFGETSSAQKVNQRVKLRIKLIEIAYSEPTPSLTLHHKPT